jgi:hypothetical protein
MINHLSGNVTLSHHKISAPWAVPFVLFSGADVATHFNFTPRKTSKLFVNVLSLNQTTIRKLVDRCLIVLLALEKYVDVRFYLLACKVISNRPTRDPSRRNQSEQNSESMYAILFLFVSHFAASFPG